MGFTSGMQALQKAIEEGKKRGQDQGQGGTSALTYFNWKAGDKKILRFCADDVITADYYDFILDKSGQTKNFLVDPADPDRLKRYMSPSPGIGWRKPPKGPIEEPKARKMTIGIAVLRQEERSGDTGKLVVNDYFYNKTVGDKVLPARQFGVVLQSTGNFWHSLATGYFNRYQTIIDRDYEISREGGGLDTKYSIIALPEDDKLSDPEKVREYYFYGAQWDKEDPDRFLKCPMTTAQWAEYFSGEERYKHWLTPGDAPVPDSPSGLGEFAQGTSHNDEAQVSRVEGTQFTSLAETLLNNTKKT